MERVVAIVNPAAGRARGFRPRARAVAELKKQFPAAMVLTASAPDYATALAREAAARADLVVAIGGDGTVREVASGLIGGAAVMAVVPAGSANDFCASVGIPADAAEACRIAREGADRAIDVGHLEIPGAPGSAVAGGPSQHYFVNVAGFGFDAQVVAEARRFKRLRGRVLYLCAVLRALVRYRCPVMSITAEGLSVEGRMLFVAVANGRSFGGGMKIAPDAALDDGLLDLCAIAGASRLTILRRLPALMRGTHVRLAEVTMRRVRSFAIESAEPLPVQLDGDLLDTGEGRRFRLEVVPRALTVRTGAAPWPLTAG